MNKSIALGAASASLLLALTACGDSDTDQGLATTTSAAVASASESAENGVEEHNDADIAFVEGMVPHHSQAIEMSDIVLAKQGVDPRVVELAQQIKAAQGPEIEQMNSWLTAWGRTPAAATTAGMDMPDGSMPMSGMDMPEAPPATSGMDMPGMEGGEMEGMMSAEDMQSLSGAQGAEAAKLFLTQMIEHHKGAITMAQTEVADGQNAQAKAMAQNIITTQEQEITTMEEILPTL